MLIRITLKAIIITNESNKGHTDSTKIYLFTLTDIDLNRNMFL